jgi:trehalose 6-phosphate phosphatase
MPPALFDRHGILRGTVRRKLCSSRRIILALDFDGTLAPIRSTPARAILPPATRTLLRKLSAIPSITVALVTGRSYSDIKRKAGLPNILLISNHGFQISSGGVHWVHPSAGRAIPLLRRLTPQLGRALRPVRNALIENKKLTLSVHYRNVRKSERGLVKSTVGRLVDAYKDVLSLTYGKKVLEIRPRTPWNKGRAVIRQLKSMGPAGSRCVVYIGDDKTDEDAFRLLRPQAVTIRVGSARKTQAAFRVSNPSQVRRFLEIVHSLNGGESR